MKDHNGIAAQAIHLDAQHRGLIAVSLPVTILLQAASLCCLAQDSKVSQPQASISKPQTASQKGASTAASQGQSRPAPSAQNQHPLTTSSNNLIGSIDNLILVDKSRNKKIALRITYPRLPGTYPVIIFSHGASLSKDAYKQLTQYWAAKGYVCVQPTHQDAMSNMHLKEGSSDFMDAVDTFLDPTYWVGRVQDVKLIIDSLSTIGAQLPPTVHINNRSIGVGGHSYGAFTANILDGATPYIPPGKVPGYSGSCNLSDPRIKAFILLSPEGIAKDGLGFPNASAWKNVKRPTMVMTGSLDTATPGGEPGSRRQPYQYEPPGDKYLVYLEGASHLTFTGNSPGDATQSLLQGLLSGGGLEQLQQRMSHGSQKAKDGKPDSKQAAKPPDLMPYILKASLAFWNAYLKDDAQSKKYLKARTMMKENPGVVKQEDK